MPGDAEQTDSSGKYTFGGGASAAKKYWPTILKSMELVFCILCLGLVDDPATPNRSSDRVFISSRVVALVYVTFGSYLIYSVIYLIGRLIRDEWPWKTTAIMACLATFLFFLCSMFLFKNWSDAKTRNIWPPNTTRLDLIFASGSIAFITAITYLVDAILMIRAGNRGEFEY